MSYLSDSLHRFELKRSEDIVKTDLEVTCTECGEVVCDAEDGDTLDVLARTADNHLATCRGEDGED